MIPARSFVLIKEMHFVECPLCYICCMLIAAMIIAAIILERHPNSVEIQTISSSEPPPVVSDYGFAPHNG